ncbi:MAG: hypothetical protein ACP5MH_11920 [Thermoproteus sp.]
MSLQVSSSNPLDWLGAAIGKTVRIYTVNGLSVTGTLKAANTEVVVVVTQNRTIFFSMYSIVNMEVQG